MRTSLNKIKEIDEHLFRLTAPQDSLLFEANMILDSNLRNDVLLQQQAHTYIKQYGRKKLKAEIEGVHQQIFSNPQHQNFVQKILRLFK